MSRKKFAIFAACGLVGLGAIALYRELADDPSAASPRSVAEAAPERALEAVPPTIWPQGPPLAGAPDQVASAALAARKEAEEDAPYPQDLTQLAKALQPLQTEVAWGLAALGERSGCRFDKVGVLLTLETGRREVLIMDVVIKPRPVESDETVETRDPDARVTEKLVDEADAHCIREALKGKVISAPSARTGRRWQWWYAPAPPPH